MSVPKIGEPARPFRLPSADGGEIALDQYRGRQAVVLWFTKGMACPFCRQQMSQLARAYPRVKERHAEILQVTNTALSRARLYARQFALPFPYLCDPDYRAHAAWGLEKRSRGPAYYAKMLIAGMKTAAPPSDYPMRGPGLADIPGLLADDDMGVFIVDRGGVVRYALAGSYLHEAGPRGLPGPDEIVRELDRCAAVA